MLIPLVRNIKRHFSFKMAAIALPAIIIAVIAGVYVYQWLRIEVLVNDNGRQIRFYTMKSVLKDALSEHGIKVREYDRISLSPDALLQRITTNKINIKRAVPVYINADGQRFKVMTCAKTVGEMLDESPVGLNKPDRLDGSKTGDLIKSDMTISVIRVKEEILKESSGIPYRVVRRENNSMDRGKSKTLFNGREGVRERIYKLVFENGKQMQKKLVSDKVVLMPRDRIVEVGTIANFTTSRGEVVRYRKVLNMKASAYTSSYADTGKKPGTKGFGITSTGLSVKKGIIAVDPRVIPLGSKVYIETAGRGIDYGFAVAADTGSSIKGNKIDVYLETRNAALSWGVRRVTVYILVGR